MQQPHRCIASFVRLPASTTQIPSLLFVLTFFEGARIGSVSTVRAPCTLHKTPAAVAAERKEHGVMLCWSYDDAENVAAPCGI